jgi:hypothetical protein
VEGPAEGWTDIALIDLTHVPSISSFTAGLMR